MLTVDYFKKADFISTATLYHDIFIYVKYISYLSLYKHWLL